jgi:hypothetical protein
LVVFLIKKMFSKVYDEGYSPLSPSEWDSQGLPGLGEGLRCWLSRVRCVWVGMTISVLISVNREVCVGVFGNEKQWHESRKLSGG